MSNKLARYRELLDTKDSIPGEIDMLLDHFLNAKVMIARCSLTENLQGATTNRDKRLKEIIKTKEHLADELRYLAFQERSLEQELEKLYKRFTAT